MYVTRKLWKLIEENAAGVSTIAFWTFISVAFGTFRLVSFGFLVLTLAENSNVQRIGACAFAAIFFTIAQRIAEHVMVAKRAEYGCKFKKSFRADLFEKLFYLGPGFIDRKQSGEIITTLWEKVEWLTHYVFYYVPVSLMIMLFSIILATSWLRMSPMMGICIFLAGLLVLACPPVFHKLIKTTSEEEWEGNDDFYSTCLDGLQGIVTLKAFNANERHRQKVEIQSEEMRKKTMANLVRTTLNSRVMELIISVGEVTSVLVGIWEYGRGSLGMTELIVLLFAMQAWSEGVRQIFGAWLRGNRGAAGYESVLEIMDAECVYSLALPNREAVLKCGAKENTTGTITKAGEIEFDHVFFSYNDDCPVLCDVNLKVEKGTRTALVGSSGSGKSTIARLLFGFYKPQSGLVKVGGQALDADTVAEIQDQITVIWQDCHIFHTSCMENIKMARITATDDEVYEAAKKANIHEMIMQLPEGYQTVIGDGGRSFSGGEKQRIAIARAFLRNAPILVLDEATSSLDRRNEMEIQECIQKLSVGKTVLTIAHRLDTVRDADQICVMESGKIVERGTHSELMKNGERYQELMGAGKV